MSNLKFANLTGDEVVATLRLPNFDVNENPDAYTIVCEEQASARNAAGDRISYALEVTQQWSDGEVVDGYQWPVVGSKLEYVGRNSQGIPLQFQPVGDLTFTPGTIIIVSLSVAMFLCAAESNPWPGCRIACVHNGDRLAEVSLGDVNEDQAERPELAFTPFVGQALDFRDPDVLRDTEPESVIVHQDIRDEEPNPENEGQAGEASIQEPNPAEANEEATEQPQEQPASDYPAKSGKKTGKKSEGEPENPEPDAIIL